MADTVTVTFRTVNDFDPANDVILLTVPAQNKDYEPASGTVPAPNHSPGDTGTNVIAKVKWITSGEAGDIGNFEKDFEFTPDLFSYD